MCPRVCVSGIQKKTGLSKLCTDWLTGYDVIPPKRSWDIASYAKPRMVCLYQDNRPNNMSSLLTLVTLYR